jgi:hypothetical protein
MRLMLLGPPLFIMYLAAGLDGDPTWDPLAATVNGYEVVGTTGLLALVIAAVISGLKRWQSHGEGAPNWWMRLPPFGRTLVVALLGVLAGVIARVQAGATPAQAFLIGLSGVFSALGHAVAQRVGVAGAFASDPERNPLVDPAPRDE